jgi:hypothetical protein
MNKDLKITLGLIAVTALGYYLWKKSQVKPAPAVVAQAFPPSPDLPRTTMPVPPLVTMPVETMAAPTSNFAYANMAAAPSGGFFDTQKVKLNY